MVKKTSVRNLPDCDVCRAEGHQQPALYDARTPAGPWAYLCETHFQALKCSLGEGCGQLLIASEKPAAGSEFNIDEYDPEGAAGLDEEQDLARPCGVNFEELVEPLKEHAVDGQHHVGLGGLAEVHVFIVQLSPAEVLLMEALANLGRK
jgi:hypothetical protein